MTVPTMDGVTAQTITTSRITTRVLFSGDENGVPVVFIHGNASSATWWEEVMVALPAGFQGIAYDQRAYGEADPAKKVDATRGMGDLADDAVALLDHLTIEKAHIVGISMGGSVITHLMTLAPERFLSAVLINPGSPYGFGGTKDTQGTPAYDDFAGSGAGLINPEFVKLIAAGERGTESPFAPRNALLRLFKTPPTRQEEWLSGMLAMHTGEQDYPGDVVPSQHWPNVAPGVWGVNNALSPKYVLDPTTLTSIDPKPPVLWIRGADDSIVSDKSLADFATLGQMGMIPGYPGEDVFPSQPMVSQTRAVLDAYKGAGGSYDEVVIDGAGHVAYIDKPDDFNAVFHAHLKKA